VVQRAVPHEGTVLGAVPQLPVSYPWCTQQPPHLRGAAVQGQGGDLAGTVRRYSTVLGSDLTLWFPADLQVSHLRCTKKQPPHLRGAAVQEQGGDLAGVQYGGTVLYLVVSKLFGFHLSRH